MRPRDLFHWKTYFYFGLLPLLRRLGPARADAALGALGRLSAVLWPSRRWRLATASAHARAALAFEARARRDRHRQVRHADPSRRHGHDPADATVPDWDDDRLAPDLAAGSLRFLARDYLLDTPDDASALARFDVEGGDALDAALADGRGVILVGGHFGGHLASFHWFYRRGIPLRVMVQRPRHISAALAGYFDRDDGDPQEGYFLRRGLGPTDCVERLLRVRAAVKGGKAVYFAGDIPWTGPNTRRGRLLGQTHQFLTVWADLSALTRAPVFFTTCSHRAGGRFQLRFTPFGVVAPGCEDDAVAAFLASLERAIAADPADAVAHLLWPCYSPPPSRRNGHRPDPPHAAPADRPSRRVPSPLRESA